MVLKYFGWITTKSTLCWIRVVSGIMKSNVGGDYTWRKTPVRSRMRVRLWLKRTDKKVKDTIDASQPRFFMPFFRGVWETKWLMLFLCDYPSYLNKEQKSPNKIRGLFGLDHICKPKNILLKCSLARNFCEWSCCQNMNKLKKHIVLARVHVSK
jgi:hypothetical protein